MIGDCRPHTVTEEAKRQRKSLSLSQGNRSQGQPQGRRDFLRDAENACLGKAAENAPSSDFSGDCLLIWALITYFLSRGITDVCAVLFFTSSRMLLNLTALI